MPVTPAVQADPETGPGGLTAEQRRAAAARLTRLNIAAGPGTGKTTVSAHRFGVERFDAEARMDPRAVVAVSFTRAATGTLSRRIRRLWGPHTIRWPHRVVTLDTIMCDLVHDLLAAGLVTWPGGHTELKVEDSWSAFGKVDRTWIAYRLVLTETRVGIVKDNLSKVAYSVDPYVSAAELREGVCTHQDVRDVLALALERPESYEHIKLRLGQRMRAFIIDEVYDANDLDLAIIDAAVEAGVRVTLVGDLWQALYVLRGARPEVVPEFLDRQGFRTLRLTHSFRWGTQDQRELADALRRGEQVELSTAPHDGDLAGLDVVLALEWAPLWELGPGVLPIGFKSFKGGHEEAAAILVLNHVTQSVFGVEATYLGDALTSLGATEDNFLSDVGPRLHAIAETLRTPGGAAVKDAYVQLAALVADHTTRVLRKLHPAHTGRLAMIQGRLLFPGRPVPGLTTHQAKGGEWDAVGVKLADTHRARLAAGLRVEGETDRKLYVACTRARLSTVEVV